MPAREFDRNQTRRRRIGSESSQNQTIGSLREANQLRIGSDADNRLTSSQYPLTSLHIPSPPERMCQRKQGGTG